ncbi:MAG: hypothetical protein ACOXZ2_05850 [Sphaerochaetaceae bacterium]|jgi:hypothetical protein|nr:hypothetical protein [Sphaerochaetaceae bacterium]HHU88689.1 hypothetical protein [Spirochaetales bacterium]
MKRIFISLALAVVLLFPLFAKASGILYRSDDTIVVQVERLLVQTGKPLPSFVSPISAYNLLYHLEMIDKDKLDEQDLSQFEKLKKELIEGDIKQYTNWLALEAGARLAPEFYLHTNLDEELTEREWMYNQKMRGDFLTFYGEATINNNFHLVYNHPFHRKLRGWESPTKETAFTGGVNTNIAFKDAVMDHSVPHSAFLGFSNNFFTFALGRDTLNIGRGSTGNMVLGDHLDYHDFLRFSIYGGPISYSFSATQFTWIDDDGIASGISFYDPFRIYVTHTLEMQFFKNLRLAITESALFIATHFDIRMFSPLMFLHNYYNQSHSDDFTNKGSYNEANNFVSFGFEWNLIPTLFLYGEIGLDQVQTAGEMTNLSNPPNAYGALLGLRFAKGITGGSFYGFIEGVYTSPYLYLRGSKEGGGDDDFLGVGWNIALIGSSNNPWSHSGVGFLGYKYGPDAIVAALKIGYDRYNSYDLFFDFELSLHGEKGLEAHGKNQNLDTLVNYSPFSPSGVIEWRLQSGVGITTTLFKSLKVLSQVNYLHRWNFRNQLDVTFSDIQIVLGLSYALKVF